MIKACFFSSLYLSALALDPQLAHGREGSSLIVPYRARLFMPVLFFKLKQESGMNSILNEYMSVNDQGAFSLHRPVFTPFTLASS